MVPFDSWLAVISCTSASPHSREIGPVVTSTLSIRPYGIAVRFLNHRPWLISRSCSRSE